MNATTYSAKGAQGATFGTTANDWLASGWLKDALLPGQPGLKIPGRWTGTKWVGLKGRTLYQGLAGAAEPTTWEEIQAWPTDTLCVRGSLYPALDIDCEHQVVVCALRQAVEDFMDGFMWWRGRSTSQRVLAPFAVRTEHAVRDWPPIRFMIPGYTPPDGKAPMIELKGAGRQWLATGTHPDGSRYEWIRDEDERGGIPDAEFDLHETNQAEMDRLREHLVGVLQKHGCTILPSGPQGGGGGHGGQDYRDPNDHPPMVELEALERALQATPCDPEMMPNHDEAVRVMSGLRWLLGDEGDVPPDCVMEWLLTYPGAGPEWIMARWESFTSIAPSPAAFLRALELHCTDTEAYRAVQGDRDLAQARELFPEEPDQVGADGQAIGERTEDVLAGLCRTLAHVWVTNEWIDMEHGVRLDEAALNKSPKGREITRLDFLLQEGERRRERPAVKIVLSRDHPNVETVTYRPGQDVRTEVMDGGYTRRAYNFWREKKHLDRVVSDAEVEPFMRVARHVFPHDADLVMFLDVCSYIAQNPGKKIQWAIVLYSRMQGVGKDTILSVLRYGVVGEWNFAAIEPTRLASEFNDDWMPRQVILVTELPSYHQRDIYDRLKEYVASGAGDLSVNPKGLRRYSMPNMHCWFFTTNKIDALRLEADDRRFAVIQAREEKLPEDIGEAFHTWAMKRGGYDLVGAWLKQRKISPAFNPTVCPQASEAKREMLQASITPEGETLADLITSGAWAERTVVSMLEVKEEMYRRTGKLMRNEEARRVLTSRGWTLPSTIDATRRINVGNRKQEVWLSGQATLTGGLTTHVSIARQLLTEQRAVGSPKLEDTEAAMEAFKPKLVEEDI